MFDSCEFAHFFVKLVLNICWFLFYQVDLEIFKLDLVSLCCQFKQLAGEFVPFEPVLDPLVCITQKVQKQASQ